MAVSTRVSSIIQNQTRAFIEEEDTVGFCWDLLALLATANLQRFATFWPPLLECFSAMSQLPLFSPSPFAEKAIVALFRVAVGLLSTPPSQRPSDSRVHEEGGRRTESLRVTLGEI